MKKLSFALFFVLSFLLFSYSVHAATFEDLINYFKNLFFPSAQPAVTGGGLGRGDREPRTTIRPPTTTLATTTTTVTTTSTTKPTTTTTATTTTTIPSNIVVRTDRSSYNYSEILYWNVTGLPPNAVISMSIPDASIGFAPDNVADSTGFASGSLTPSDYLQPGNHTLRATLKSDSSKYGEAAFSLSSPCATPTLPTTIYSSNHFDWIIKKASVYCNYINHTADVSKFFPLPELLFNWYTTNLGGADKMNFRITFVLDTPGGGYASGHEFGIADDAFWNYNYNLKGWWAYQLMAHEFGNLYTGNTLSGGWPCDWWADHGACPSVPGFESPAPMSFANSALQQINWQASSNVSQNFYNENKNDVLFIMFRDKLIGKYGIGMFKTAFNAARQDSMDWTKIDNGINPGALLTNYVAAYLTIGAGTDLSPIFNEYANKSYPSGMVGFDGKVMNDMIAARNLIYNATTQGKDVAAAWNAYRTGKYQDVKNLIVDTTTTTTIPQYACSWGISYQPASGAGNGIITKGSKIKVSYLPLNTEYYTAGQKIISPNKYFELVYEGWNTDRFVNIKIQPITGISVYNQSDVYSSNVNGLEISSDISNSLAIGSVKSNKFYLLFDLINGNNYPVILAYWDAASGKAIVYQMINSHVTQVSYQFMASYSNENNPYFLKLNFPLNGNNLTVTSGINGKTTISSIYNFVHPWLASYSPALKLGSNSFSEAGDIRVTTDGSYGYIGLFTNDVVDDSGIIVSNPSQYTSVDSISLKIPEKVLGVKAYLGKIICSTSPSGGGCGMVGIERDGINICDQSASPTTCNLTYAADNYTAFPSTILNSSHYSGLKDSVVTWKSNNYDYYEQVDVSGVYMDHNLGSTNINGIEKMVVGTNGKIKYEYVFDKDLNFGGSITNPEYTYPVKIKLMDKDFVIAGAGTTSIKVLQGSIGTATATSPVNYGNYKFYATIGSTNSMQIDVKDSAGSPVEKLLFTGITSGTASTKPTTKTSPLLDVTITSFAVSTDGTVIKCDIVIGPIGTTIKEFDTTADIGAIGVANDCFTETTTTSTTTTLPSTTTTSTSTTTITTTTTTLKPTTTTITPSRNCKDNKGICILSIFGYGRCPKGYLPSAFICPYSWISRCCTPS
jgi:hypothetical protein